jgi:DNA repair exonuclease SbcCD ATPase subunit
MKIIKFKAENVKKLSVVEIVPEKNIIKITGKNEQGKTTVLDSIWWALGGTKDIQDQPIRQGQTEGKIELDLGEIIVTRTFNAKTGGSLEVRNKVGSRAPLKSPQAVIDNLINKNTFDPWSFIKADKKKQAEILLGIVNLQIDYEKLEKIAGFKPHSLDPLEAINEVYKLVYNERVVVNRDLDKAKKALESLPQGTVKTEKVSLVELVSEKERLEKENRDNDEKRSNARQLANEADQVKDSINDIEAEIQELEIKKAELEASLEKKQELASAAADEVAQLADNDLTDINSRISKADETNKMAEAWEKQENVIRDVAEFQQESDACTAKLEEIKQYKQDLVNNAKFPIQGLDFGGGGVLYQGLPFEQASGTAKLQVSMAIGMALNPNLRIMQIDEANSIDSEHMRLIEQMAADNDFQIWMTVTDESGQVGVYIEDGEVKANNYKDYSEKEADVTFGKELI